jgi:membrane peptidoglycan carboxypeptidase
MVLDAMVRAGSISALQADMAATEPIHYADGDCRPGTCTTAAPHFVAFVLNDLVEQLGADPLARGGLTITTTIDLGLQEAAQAILKRQIDLLAQPRDGGPDHRARNGAVVTLDPADGAILAMVGSPDFADSRSQGQVNATIALRQPGSALKPLTYAAALERGWTPASMLFDVPTSFPTREGQPYTPQNYDRAYHGPIPLREALATSSNIAAVRLLHEIGLQSLLDMAERLGIHSLGQDPSRYGLALTLGGGEVTLLELTGSYAAFANGGNRITPYSVLAITDAEGQAVNIATRIAPVAVLSPQVAYLITNILADPYARMRAFGLESVLDIGRPAAAKTGTTTDWRDNWTVGYTPDRAVGVWVGNADGSPMEAVSGITGAGPVWRAVMQAAHRDLPAHAFARPAGLIEADICSDSGLLPGPNCPATRRELFIAGTAPDRPDNTHIALRVDLHLGCRALAGYPIEKTAMRVFRILPPEAELWAADAGVPVPPRKICPNLGPVTDNVNSAHTEAIAGGFVAPRIVSPARGAIFALSPGVPLARQRLEIAAQGGDSVVHLTIFVDDLALASFSGPPYRAFWALTPGQHTISIKAQDRQGRVIQSEPSLFSVEGLP